MERAMQHIKNSLTALVKIYRSATDRRLKQRIVETWLRVFFLHRFDGRNQLANILGYKVKFLDYDLLAFLFKELFIENNYYFNAQKSDPLIIDCGSNIGMSILYFNTLYPKSRIVGFEPADIAFLCLKENIKNNLLDSVTVYNVALSDKEGFTELYYDPEHPGSLYMSIIPERFPKHKRRVEASLLSKYIEEEIDFLKIDIEGAELSVLQEICSAGKIYFVQQMVIEYHHHIKAEWDYFSRILGVLENVGFGYQIESKLGRPLKPRQFQDILIFAYRKKPAPGPYH